METSAACANCHAPVETSDPSCPSCGTSLTGAEAETSYSTLGEGILARHKGARPSVKKSARWLLYLSLLFAVFGTIGGMFHHSEAKEALQFLDTHDDADVFVVEGEQYTVADLEAEIKKSVWLVFGSSYLLAGVMLGLFFWARTKPFHAMLLGLCIYLGLIALGAYYDPDTLFQAVFLKAIIIIAMIAGIRAAYAERAEAAKLPRASLAS